MENAFGRLSQAIGYLKDNGRIHKQQDIANTLGMGKARVSEALQGKPTKFTEGFLKRFAAAYSEYINEEWLVEGIGEMAKVDKKKFRPRVPLSVSAGYTDITIGTALDGECAQEPVNPDFPSYDFTIHVSGDSMLPKLQDNDIIACRWLSDIDEVKPDTLYVLDTLAGAVVKEIRLTKASVLCHSLNPRYEDFAVAKDDILRIAKVVGLSRSF